jgi:hypothetical protein
MMTMTAQTSKGTKAAYVSGAESKAKSRRNKATDTSAIATYGIVGEDDFIGGSITRS